MDNVDFWDDYEFNFFMDLEDEDKLLYIYDLMIGDFTSEYFNESDEIDFEFELDDSAGEHSIRQEVTAIFTDGKLSLVGVDIEVLDKVANDMFMNGVILSDRNVVDNGKGVLITFNVIGRESAISLN